MYSDKNYITIYPFAGVSKPPYVGRRLQKDVQSSDVVETKKTQPITISFGRKIRKPFKSKRSLSFSKSI